MLEENDSLILFYPQSQTQTIRHEDEKISIKGENMMIRLKLVQQNDFCIGFPGT